MPRNHLYKVMINHKECDQITIYADDETYDSYKAIMAIEAVTEKEGASLKRVPTTGITVIQIGNTIHEVPPMPTLPHLLTICGLMHDSYRLNEPVSSNTL